MCKLFQYCRSAKEDCLHSPTSLYCFVSNREYAKLKIRRKIAEVFNNIAEKEN